MNPPITANPLASDLPDPRHSLLERSPVPMAELEGVGHVIRYVNPAFCRLVGKSKEVLIGKPFADTVQEGDSCLALLARVFRTGEAETHLEPAHPEPHPAYWSYAMWPVLDGEQRPVGVMVQVTETTPFHQQMVTMNEALLRSSVRQHELTETAEKLNERFQGEITERKQTEAALRESEEKYRTLFDSIDEGFCLIEKVEGAAGEPVEFRYVEANPAFAAHSGVRDVVGKTMRQAVPGEPEEWFDMYDTVLSSGEPIRCERRLVTQGRVLDLYAFRVEDDTQRRVAVLFKDITARKQAEAERERLLAELQRINDELQQFAHIVSHDLNEPLRTMRNFIGLLARRYQRNLDAEADEYMGFVTEGAQRMQAMLQGLLDYTRTGGQELTFALTDCEALVRSVCNDLQAAIEESGATVTHDPLPTVPGDATHLGQVLQNLIGNALKFRGAAPSRVHISAQREGQHWRFAVRDNGIGIEPRHAERIFQIFQRLHTRREYSGTGIGLAICKKIVERHGGHIWVESEVGKGATFFFTI